MITKYKKIHKRKLMKFESKTKKLKFGTIGLKSLECGLISEYQIKAAKFAILKNMKSRGKVWVRIFVNTSISSKQIGSRMGKGKGNISHWVSKIKKGSILFEVCGVNISHSIKILKSGSSKLSVKTKVFL